MVLVCDRCAKQGHETITEKLVDGSLHAMNFRERELEEVVEQRMHAFCANTLREFG